MSGLSEVTTSEPMGLGLLFLLVLGFVLSRGAGSKGRVVAGDVPSKAALAASRVNLRKSSGS